ncbi:hypothetical protein [Cytobacillus kochii]|uniref:hypothetical protein n=1 Tax=Cytobacillus kochii TaxID=859143 RepID=UPI0025A2696E|nr:hypothetical protein [Cytobacillus kochii]MDM5207656.1 hypothetical protein [Cytobacillus kochii]
MPNEQRNMGIISFISLIVGVISITAFLVGITLVNDNVTMITGLIFLVITLILSLFSKKNLFGKISLYVSATLLIVFVIFFVGRSDHNMVRRFPFIL